MKITVFTSNQPRHLYLINSLIKCCDELNIIQECQTVHTGILKGQYEKSDLVQRYFSYVLKSQKKLFNNNYLSFSNENINYLPLKFNDLSYLDFKYINNFLKSDIFIVFGSSYIRGKLANFLVRKKAINIHMGISPYYRGTDCNFWALYDNKPEYVGATIHLLNKGLDDGPILYHALPKFRNNVFDFSMTSVKSAIDSLSERIKSKEIFNYKPIKQQKTKIIRYSTKKDFNDKVIKKFFKNMKKNIKLDNYSLDKLYNPYFLK